MTQNQTPVVMANVLRLSSGFFSNNHFMIDTRWTQCHIQLQDCTSWHLLSHRIQSCWMKWLISYYACFSMSSLLQWCNTKNYCVTTWCRRKHVHRFKLKYPYPKIQQFYLPIGVGCTKYYFPDSYKPRNQTIVLWPSKLSEFFPWRSY